MKYSIGIDTRMIRHTGIGTYIKGLLRGFLETACLPGGTFCTFGGGLEFGEDGGWEHRPFYSPIYSLTEQIEYPLRLRHCRLWHAPHYNVPLVKGETRLVVTIHDVIHWIFRKELAGGLLKELYAQRMMKRAIETADQIIAVSNQTKYDLVEYFDADPEKISVIYEGVDDIFAEYGPERQGAIEAVKQKYAIATPYFLYVGNLKPHKNVLFLIRVFRRLQSEGVSDATLVLVGKKDSQYAAPYRELKQLQSGNGILHLSSVSQEELVALYNGALGLIHPSLYEGFGLTLLEAMACGTPVIATRTASIPEVVGEAAYLVDPCSERELSDAIVRFEKLPALRDDWRRKGKRHVRQFQWREAARRTADIYQKILEQP